MIEVLKKEYRKFKIFFKLLQFYYRINWVKTIYFNFKKFPFKTAKKLPVYFYGKVKFTSISGEIIIDYPIKNGIIGFGQPYEIISKSKGTAELFLEGKLVFKGHVQFGKDYFVHVDKNAYCEFGHLASIGRDGKIICKNEIILGELARLGFESQVIDTNFHQMYDTLTKEKFKINAPIKIGNNNYIGNRVSIMLNTKTPNFCSVASNSLCNKDYTNLGENILIGGIPSKLLKTNISRDWEGEKERLKKYLIV